MIIFVLVFSFNAFLFLIAKYGINHTKNTDIKISQKQNEKDLNIFKIDK